MKGCEKQINIHRVNEKMDTQMKGCKEEIKECEEPKKGCDEQLKGCEEQMK
jgi:hypothetical protein